MPNVAAGFDRFTVSELYVWTLRLAVLILFILHKHEGKSAVEGAKMIFEDMIDVRLCFCS